ncbi:MAG TPA: hypothetical protein VK458_04790 [Myxococcaceae bacterium]|nr:hypothetical protein [Myxococcaceae bacterium]
MASSAPTWPVTLAAARCSRSLGRKNWLFLGSDAAGHRAASVYSLVLSCCRLGMDPWAYFRDVLPKLGDTRFPASRFAQLLHESWAQQQAQQP